MSIVIDFLESLITEGGDGNFLIVNFKENAYIQFAVEKGGKLIYCETSASNPKTNILLDSTQISTLHQLGWTEGSSDFHQYYKQTKSLGSDDDLAQLEKLIHETAAVHGVLHQLYTYDLNLE